MDPNIFFSNCQGVICQKKKKKKWNWVPTPSPSVCCEVIAVSDTQGGGVEGEHTLTWRPVASDTLTSWSFCPAESSLADLLTLPLTLLCPTNSSSVSERWLFKGLLDSRVLSLMIEDVNLQCRPFALRCLILSSLLSPFSSSLLLLLPLVISPQFVSASSLRSEAVEPLVCPSTDNEATEVVWASVAQELEHRRKVD